MPQGGVVQMRGNSFMVDLLQGSGQNAQGFRGSESVQRTEEQGQEPPATTETSTEDPVLTAGLAAVDGKRHESYRWLDTELGAVEGEEAPDYSQRMLLFDDRDVHRLLYYMLTDWVGVSDPQMFTKDSEAAPGEPGWVEILRTHALSPHEKDPNYARDLKLAQAARAMCDAVAEETDAQRYRRALVAEADKRVEDRYQIIDPDLYKRLNEEGGYTTCMDFEAQTTNSVATATGLESPHAANALHYKEVGYPGAKVPLPNPAAWIPAEGGGRPRPGDILVLSKPASIDKFAHVAFMRSIIKHSAQEEEWISDDGGGIVPMERNTYFDVSQRELWVKKQEERQGWEQPRYLVRGWLDIGKMVQGTNK
jgi:hypothetical protein